MTNEVNILNSISNLSTGTFIFYAVIATIILYTLRRYLKPYLKKIDEAAAYSEHMREMLEATFPELKKNSWVMTWRYYEDKIQDAVHLAEILLKETDPTGEKRKEKVKEIIKRLAKANGDLNNIQEDVLDDTIDMTVASLGLMGSVMEKYPQISRLHLRGGEEPFQDNKKRTQKDSSVSSKKSNKNTTKK